MRINYTLLMSLSILGSLAIACPEGHHDDHTAQANASASDSSPIQSTITVNDNLKIIGSWARPGQCTKNTAAYMTIKNSMPDNTDRLIKAECSVAKAVELHDHINQNGIMQMRPVPAIDIKDEVNLKPGSLHIMLMDLKQDLKAGDTVEMKLTFEKAGPVTIKLPVQQPKV